MHPTHWTEYLGRINFHYTVEDWNNFHRLGDLEGTVGALLTGIVNGYFVYHCYGTLEAPCKQRRILQLMHNEAFDGKYEGPDWYCKPAVEKRALEQNKTCTYRFVVLELNQYQPL